MSLNYMGLFDLVEHYGFDETNALYSKLNCDVNLITFQSLDVLKLLFKNKVYIANPNKARERQDYGADIEQLGGHTPVWCFSPFIKNLGYSTEFNKEFFRYGNLFVAYAREMCLPSIENFSKFFLLELRVPSDIIKVGITRNGYEGAVVIPKIEMNNLVAVYKLHYTTDDYYPSIKVLKIFKNNSIFDTDFKCESHMSAIRRKYLNKK